MRDANRQSSLSLRRGLILLGLALLTGVFAWLTYREIRLFSETWRVRPNVIIQTKMGFRVLIMLMLTTGAALGPVVFLLDASK
jgi:hypothetical protein